MAFLKFFKNTPPLRRPETRANENAIRSSARMVSRDPSARQMQDIRPSAPPIPIENVSRRRRDILAEAGRILDAGSTNIAPAVEKIVEAVKSIVGILTVRVPHGAKRNFSNELYIRRRNLQLNGHFLLTVWRIYLSISPNGMIRA
jgi:hypothetical protein